MKKTLLAVVIALGATAAFAQVAPTATQLCQNISAANSTNGNVCAQLISRNRFDDASLRLAQRALSTQNSSAAIEVMKLTANKRLEPSSGLLVEEIMAANSTNSLKALSLLLDVVPQQEILQFSRKLLSAGNSSVAIQGLEAGINKYFYAPLLGICDAMISVNQQNAIVCLNLVANKVSMNSSEQVCRTALNNGSSYALECLRGIVVDYTPIPEPTTIMVQEYQLRDLKRSILKSRAALDRGMIDPARRSLEEAVQTLELILSTAPSQR